MSANTVIIKVINNDRCAHATSKTMKVEEEITVEKLHEKFCRFNTLLEEGLLKGEYYGLYHEGKLLSPDTTLKSLGTQNNDRFMFYLLPDASVHLAVAANSVDVMERLNKVTNFFELDPKRRNFLHALALSTTETPDEEVLKILLKKKVSAHAHDSEGQTPISYAIKSKKLKMVSFLLKHVPDSFSVPDSQQRLPLHELCCMSLMDIEEKFTLINDVIKNAAHHVQDKNGDYPVHEAARHGDTRIVSIFLDDCGIDVDFRNGEKETPLLLAAERKNIPLICYLVHVKKANLFLANCNGIIPLDYAFKYNLDEMLKHLALPPKLEIGEDLFRATHSCTGEDTAPFKQAMQTAIEVLPPAAFAIKLDELQVKETKKGKPLGLGFVPPPPPSPTTTSLPGFTRAISLTTTGPSGLEGRRKALINNCLILCAFRGKYEFVKLILSDYSRDIDNNHKFLDTWSLCSVLMMNFSSDRLYNELLSPALKIELTKSIRYTRKRTLLHLAILHGNFYGIQLLSSKGESIGMFDEYGYNELHLCVMSGNVQFLRYLLGIGCDPFMSSISGETPLSLAGRYKRRDMETVLNHHLGNPVEEIDGLSLKPKPNMVTVTIIKSLNIIHCDSSVTLRPYCKLSHKLCGKKKVAKSPEVCRTVGASSSVETNFDGCEAELESYFARRGNFNFNLAMLDYCQSGNLKMVKYLAEKKGVNPLGVRGTKKKKAPFRALKKKKVGVDGLGGGAEEDEMEIVNLEEVKTESKTDKRKSVIGRRTPFGLASSSSISASVLSPSSPSAPSTPPCTASTNSLSCSQPLVTRSPSPSPGPLSPSPSPFASQPQLQHTRSISPGMRLTAVRKPPRKRKGTGETQDEHPTPPLITTTNTNNHTTPTTPPLTTPPATPPLPAPTSDIPPPLSQPQQISASLSCSPSSSSSSPSTSSPCSPSSSSTCSSSLVTPPLQSGGLSPTFGAQDENSFKKPIRTSSVSDFDRSKVAEEATYSPRLERTNVFYGRRSMTAKDITPREKRRAPSPSRRSGGAPIVTEFGVEETPMTVAKGAGQKHVVNFLLQHRERESYFTSSSQAGEGTATEHAVQNLIFNPTRKPLPSPPNLEIEWSYSADFVIKKGNEICREMELQVLSSSPNLPDEVHEELGRCLIILDFATSRRRSYILTLQTVHGISGEIEIQLRFQEKENDKVTRVEEEYHPIDPLEAVRKIKRSAGKKKIGVARKALGGKPNYPILIVPGLASSALEAFDTEEKEWLRERVWIDPFKIGKFAVFEKVSQRVFGSKKESLGPKDFEKKREKKQKKEKKKKEDNHADYEFDDETQKAVGEAERKRKWIAHMTLANDGYSDPPGIKVRPVPGLHGIDFLAQNAVAKAQSYVFAHVVRALIDFGYDYCTLDACSYDWRLPPEKLQERDNYFGLMMRKIEAMSEHQGRKVVLLAHSMGNRVVQYFFRWVQMKRSKDWINRNIYAFLAMGAPFLGSSKALRTVLCGDAMGLEVFLTKEEALLMARVSSSLPWLFPVSESSYPDEIIRVHSEDKSSEGKLPYHPHHFSDVLHQYVPRSLGYYETFYQNDPLYLFKEEESTLPPVLEPPPVERVWVINGINRETEVGYYMKGGKQVMLDPSADKYSRQKKAGINPRGLLIREGIAYESSDTFQPSIKLQKSGDGTVPFCSLNYAETGWRDKIHVYTKEIEDAEHREMLASDAILNQIIDYVCLTRRTKQEEEEDKALSTKALSYLMG